MSAQTASGHAVCYTATPGYLFHTLLSAVQARAHTGAHVGIFLICFGSGRSDEEQAMQRICKHEGIEFVNVPREILNGLHPTYSRLFLDSFLPADIQEVLYLDGDTQVIADLDPLLRAPVRAGSALAVRDPMVFIYRVNKPLQVRIKGWWDASGIPDSLRDSYVNAGVLRIRRADMESLRHEVLDILRTRGRALSFLDQDAINLALGDKIEPISMAWNFPGFLLNTRLQSLAPPRIVHFMSNPRPWQAPLPPWGAAYFDPYSRLAQQHPDLRQYWPRADRKELVRSYMKQGYKYLTERPSWQSPAAAAAVRRLEADVRSLA